MNKIIINGRFLTKNITGVQRYAREIINELDSIVETNEIEIAVPYNCSNIPKYKNISIKKVGKLSGNLWEQISFPLYVKRKNGIALNLCNTAPIINTGIICIHDMKIKAKPEYFSKKFLLWYNFLFNRIIKNSIKIITVSEFSKSEIIKYYKVSNSKIKVIYNAWQHYERIKYDENTFNKYGLEKNNYYFAMSSLEPNKNFKWIAEIAKRNKNDIFTVAGSINKKVFSNGLGFNCPANMKLLGYISDEEAKALMRDCKAFLFPSFYEGFGIPPLEAVSAGTKKLVISDTEIMHEIFSENANYIDPADCIYDISFHQLKETNSKEILNKYSWRKSAEKLKNVIKEENNNEYR